MSATMNDLHAVGLNPFAVQLLAESMLKSAYVKHCGTQPLTFNYPVQREDCAGWIGVRITIEAVSVGEQPPAEAVPSDVTDAMALAFHRALTDGAIGQSEVEEIKIGLRAAIAAQKGSAT